jgi:hypothetical protein
MSRTAHLLLCKQKLAALWALIILSRCRVCHLVLYTPAQMKGISGRAAKALVAKGRSPPQIMLANAAEHCETY